MRYKCFNYFIFCIAILFTSCSVGSNSSQSSQTPTSADYTKIQIGNISTIPRASSNSSEYATVSITNSSGNDITLQNTQINAGGHFMPAPAIASYVDLGDCLHISKDKSCRAKILVPDTVQTYLLTLTFEDSSGNAYAARQIISFNALLPVQNGFIYDATKLDIGNQKSLSIPFRLADNYSKVNVTMNDSPIEFSCNQNKYTINTLCTAIVEDTNLAVNTTGKVKITGYNGSQTNDSTFNVTYVYNSNSNIITSGLNVVVNPDDGTNPQTVYLVNTGVTDATDLMITPQTPITIESNTCGTTLSSASPGGCAFVINVRGSITSGQSLVNISYFDGQSTQVLDFNVSYINQVTPALTITSSGSFSNVVVNAGPIYIWVNVSNTGSTDLTNLQFNDLSSQKSTMSSFNIGSTCVNGQTLKIGQSCAMVLSYSPTAVENGTVNFIPTGTYTGAGGQSLTYANSILQINYSAVANATFTAVGEYGTVISSTNSPPTTWSANINSPFATSSTVANGISINNGVYAVMLNSGVVESSTQNGLFWKAVPTTVTGLSASNCGLVFDGTNYYTCGTANGSTGTPCVNGSPCIERSSNLTSWTKLYKPSLSNTPYNTAYYINFLGARYLFGQANTTANTGITVSTDGTNFSEPNTGLTAANSNVTAFSIMPSTTGTAAWTSTGFSTSSSNLTSWTAGTSQPAGVTAPIGGVAVKVVGGTDNYWVTINSGSTVTGNIYVVAGFNPTTGTYTLAYSGSTGNPLRGLVYNSGLDTFVAAGGTNAVYKVGAGNWTLDTTSPGNYTAAYFSGSNSWLVGTSAIYTSPTVPPAAGSSWQAPALIDITKNESGTYLAIDNSGFIYSSTNLTAWTQQTNPSGKKLSNISCILTNNICFAIGESGVILKTTDSGTNWTQLTSGTTNYLRGVTCQNGKCVIVGGTGSASSGTILSSTDYTTWTVQTSSLATTNLNSISFFNGQFLTVGDAGTLFASANAINWASKTSGAGANNLNSIACGNLGCVAVGNGGTIVFSATGASWAAQTSGTTNTLNKVTSNGLFVAVGASGTIKQSTNGTTWNNGTFPGTSSSTTKLFSVISR
ncbi:MAG: hypothetical protein K0R14_1933 [Burkholderiales bacterium]|jgi:hypothetical protein|nr:hypothetical protein [Burkholderiales bacterium]